jgi:hypothetical protein
MVASSDLEGSVIENGEEVPPVSDCVRVEARKNSRTSRINTSPEIPKPISKPEIMKKVTCQAAVEAAAS